MFTGDKLKMGQFVNPGWMNLFWVGIGRNHHGTKRNFTVADFCGSLIFLHAKPFGFAGRLARTAG